MLIFVKNKFYGTTSGSTFFQISLENPTQSSKYPPSSASGSFDKEVLKHSAFAISAHPIPTLLPLSRNVIDYSHSTSLILVVSYINCVVFSPLSIPPCRNSA